MASTPDCVRRQIYYCFSFYPWVLPWCLAQKKYPLNMCWWTAKWMNVTSIGYTLVLPSLPHSKGAWSQPEWRNSQMCSVFTFPGLPLGEGPPTESPVPRRAALDHPPYAMAPWTSTSPSVTGEARLRCRFKPAWLLESWEGQFFPSEWKDNSCEPQLKNCEMLIKASRFLSRPLGSPLHLSPPHSLEKQGGLQFTF